MEGCHSVGMNFVIPLDVFKRTLLSIHVNEYLSVSDVHAIAPC